MNASTSPFYPLFASLDVNAKIHEGKAGEMLWDRCIELGIDARKKLREFGRFYAETGQSAEEQWFFDPFVPDVVTIRGSPSTDRRDRRRVGGPADRGDQGRAAVLGLRPEAPLARLRRLRRRLRDGRSQQAHAADAGHRPPDRRLPGFGVPATVLANFLREQRVVPEKCDLNSILFLMTPAEDESKLNTLIAKLVKFKDLWDRDAPLADVLPTLYAAHSERYAGYTLRQVCNEMHDFYRDRNVKELQRLCFRAVELPGAGDVAEGRLRSAGRQRRRLRAARRESAAGSPRRWR